MSIVPNTVTKLHQAIIPDTDESDTLQGDLLVHTFTLGLPGEVFSSYYYNYENSEYEDFTANNDFRLIPNHICEAYGIDNLSGINPKLEEGEVDKYGNLAYVLYSEEKEWKNHKDNYYSNYVKEDFRIVPTNERTKYNNIFITPEFETSLMNNFKHVPNYMRIRIDAVTADDGSLYKALKDNKDLTEAFLLMKRTSPEMVTFTYTEEDLPSKEIKLKTWKFEIKQIDTTPRNNELILERKLYKGYLQSRINRITQDEEEGGNYDDIGATSLVDIDNPDVGSEIIGYKIEKITRGVVVQTYYVDRNLVDLNDTQYKFDQQYTYRISQIVVVFGVSGEAGDNSAALTASTRIIEIPFKEINFRAITWPIDSPHVKAYTKGNENHRVDFLIEDREGHSLVQTSEMISVLDEDSTYVSKVQESSFYVNNEVKFSSRAASGQYQMFKLDHKPESYSDFSQGFLGTIGEANYNLNANFVDYIPYNKKMYYAFRSINHRGEPGNLSLVKEIELVQDADENILIQNDYDIEKKDDFDPTIDFRRFIRIVPEIEHVLFKEEIESNTLNTNTQVLGTSGQENLWQYKDGARFFKLRLTNKTSGQKFDINLRFINKQSS